MDTGLTAAIPLYKRANQGVKQDLTEHIQARSSKENLKLTFSEGKQTGEKVGYVIGPSSGNIQIRVHNNTPDNVLKGVVERVFLVKRDGQFTRPLIPVSRVFNTRLGRFRGKLVSALSGTTPYTYDQFIDCYQGRRKTRYTQAKDDLLRNGAGDPSSDVVAFGKVEKFNYTLKPQSAMRIISPRSYPYNLEVGAYIKALEHPLYRAVRDIFGETTIFKGLNAEQQGSAIHRKWLKYDKPVAVGIDVERFDQSVSSDALKWEHSIYNGVFCSNTLRRLLTKQLCNRVKISSAEWFITYVVEGSRMSGDMNTALGNCLIMCAIIYAFMEMGGIALSLANNGDDCSIIMDQSSLVEVTDKLPTFFRDFGFKIVMEEPVYEIEGIDFCQTHPVFDGQKYIMVRDPRTAISKDCYSIKPLDNESVYTSWLSAVGQGGLSLTGGIPVWQEFYRSFVRASRGAKALVGEPTLETGMFMLARDMHRKHAPVCAEARVSFYMAFDITPDEQIILEEKYRDLTPYWSGPDVGFVTDLGIL